MSIDNATPAEWDKVNKLGESYSDLINSTMTDNVNHPPHYNKGSVECIQAIQAMLTPDEFVGYLRGNSLKYRWRMRYKSNPVQDMEKAEWYEKKLKHFWLENRDDLG